MSFRAIALAAAITGIVAPVTFGQVFSPNAGAAAGVYGTPYGTLGLGGAKTWEQYRKYADFGYGGFGAVTGANVSGNNTAVDFMGAASLAKPDWSGSVWHAPGVFVDSSGGSASTPSSGSLYLRSSKNPDATNGGFDLRIGFMSNPTAFLAGKGGDGAGTSNSPQDLGESNWGTNGAYMHIQTNQDGTNWNVAVGGGGEGSAGGSLRGSTTSGSSVVTRTLITSGATPTHNGALTTDALEMSWKLTSISPTDVQLQAKLGNNLYTMHFNPGDSAFDGGNFDWANAKAVAFVGKAVFSQDPAKNPTTMRMGITLPGDANADGMVDVTDLGLLATNYGMTDAYFAAGDFNSDGIVDVTDLGTLATHYGAGAPLASSFSQDLELFPSLAATVPEPSVVACGFAGLFLLKRSRRRRA